MTYLHSILDFYGLDMDHTASPQNISVCLGFFKFLALALGRNDGFIAIEMIGSCVNHVHIDSDE